MIFPDFFLILSILLNFIIILLFFGGFCLIGVQSPSGPQYFNIRALRAQLASSPLHSKRFALTIPCGNTLPSADIASQSLLFAAIAPLFASQSPLFGAIAPQCSPFGALLLRKSSATRCVGGSAPKPPACGASFLTYGRCAPSL